MLIPSIDLMGGKIVQLVQGEKKKLEFDNFDYWIERFSKYPIVQLIDLDAARGTGEGHGCGRWRNGGEISSALFRVGAAEGALGW